MRLTLRTLLCYLDDVLDQADADDLAQKIRENPQAAKLAHNIRDVTHRSRLGAPRLDGKGLAVDANTVAEYLDNTLPTENYPDFEKVCLESDMHMAEVASCHQILTLVLGGPVEVDSQLRQRMYRVGTMTEAERLAQAGQRSVDAPASPTVPEPKSAELTAAATASRAKPEVPDYMKSKKSDVPDPMKSKKSEVPDYMKVGRRSRFWPTVAALAVGFAITAIVLVMMGPLNQDHPLARLFGGGEPAPKPVSPAPAPEARPEAVAPNDKGSGAEALSPPEEKPADVKPEAGAAAKPAVPAPTPEAEAKPEVPPPAAEKSPPAEAPVTPPAPAAPEKGPEPPGPAVALVGPENDKGAPKPDEPVQVARFASEDQILARFEPQRQEWTRVPARGMLTAGQEFIAPPAFRPQVLLATVQLTLDGGTHMILGHPAADGMPRVAINSGRFLILTQGRAGAQVELTLGHGRGARQGVLTFGDADSAAAINVFNYRYPGADPELAPVTPVVQIFCTSGRVGFEQRSGTLAVEAGRVLNLVDEQPASKIAAGTLPDWIDVRKSISEIDRRAARALYDELAHDRPLALSLKEKAEDRRAEVRSLAIRSLGYFDQFDLAVTALGDESLRSYWPAQFDMLQDGLARSPETAARVRVALEKARLDSAKTLYRLLWGYSPEELARGSGAELVEMLDHENLDIRVLAFENLRRITGTTLTYQATATAPRRAPIINRWREKLKANQIVYATLPSPIPEARPTVVPAKPPVDEEKAAPAPAVTPPPPAPGPAPEKLPAEPASEPLN